MYPVISIGNIIIPLFNAFIIFGIILSILLFLILEEKKLGKQEVDKIMELNIKNKLFEEV